MFVSWAREGGVLMVLLAKIATRKIGLFHTPTGNLVYIFSPTPHNVFPFISDFEFGFPLITPELGEDDF